MKTKTYLIIILAALAFVTGCYDDDKLWKAVNEQEQRLAALETWQKIVNDNIRALQTLVSGQKYITDVIPVTLADDTIGYTITFSGHEPVIIYYGAKGDKGEQGAAPAIGIKQVEDNNWYWTLNGSPITDASGAPIRANGQPGQAAPAPVLKTGQALTDEDISGTWTPEAVYLSTDNGVTWTQVSGPQGDAIFQKDGIDNTHPDYVVFTLADGTTTIKLPRVSEITIGIKGVTDEILIKPSETTKGITVELQLPDAGQYKAILAEIISKEGTGTDIATRAMSPWKAKILPGQNPGDAPQLNIIPGDGAAAGEQAVLKLSLIDNRNKEHQAIFMVSVSAYAWYLRGKSSGVYEITCAEELRVFAGLTKSKSDELAATGEPKPLTFIGKTVKIADGVTEIDLGPEEWSPIGSAANFRGTFDGNNAEIKNLSIDSKFGSQGFFSIIENATIKNVIISGTVQGNGSVGGIVGNSSGTSVIIHCVNHARVDANNVCAGGIVGYMNGGRIIACENYGKIRGGNMVGGIVGSSMSVELLACINEGDVTAPEGDDRFSGGIAGEFLGSKKYLAACLSKGEITGAKGGIAGKMSDGKDQYAHNYFMNDSQGIYAVGDKPELGQASTLDIINQAIPEMNKTIKQWNATHLDTPCNYHYESNTGGNLPKLVAAAPE